MLVLKDIKVKLLTKAGSLSLTILLYRGVEYLREATMNVCDGWFDNKDRMTKPHEQVRYKKSNISSIYTLVLNAIATCAS